MADGSCTGGSLECWIASQTSILANIAKSLVPVEKLITGGAYLIGIVFIFKAIYSLKIYGESRTMMSGNNSMKEPLVYFLAGAMLLYLPSTFSALMQTTFGYDNVLQYAPINSSNQALNSLFGSGSAIGQPLVLFIQVIGLVAFVRGWVLIARSASQGQPPGGTGKGLMHVFGGILAINIVGTVNMINNTIYGV